MKKKFDVLVAGTLNVDIVISGEAPREIGALLEWVDASDVALLAAGSAGYCAVDMSRLGLRVSMLSTVADDVLGRWTLERLQAEGVDIGAVSLDRNAASGMGIYMLLFGSRKRPLTGRLATHVPWPGDISEEIETRLKTSRHLHCGGYLHYPDMWGEPTERLYMKAREYGLTTSLDPQFPMARVEGTWLRLFGGLLKHVDILFTDETEAGSITGEAAPEKAADLLLEQGPGLVVVKLGSDGALLVSKEERVHQPAFKIEDISDSIGAGDAFDAGVIYAALNGMSLEDTARLASATAALTLGGMGGTSSAPSLEEVKSFLKKYKEK